MSYFFLLLKKKAKMFQKKIILNVTETLTVIWHKDWSNLKIKHDGKDIGTFPDKAALETGKWLNLNNGKPILVRLVKNELEIWLDNNELFSGLKSGESDAFATAHKTLLAYGIVFIGIGLLIGFAGVGDNPLSLGITAGICILGGAYIGLSFWAKQSRLKLPLQLALGLHGLATLLTILSGYAGILQVILLYYLRKGVIAKPLNSSEIEVIKDDGLLDSEL
jgi:hypothetical protein